MRGRVLAVGALLAIPAVALAAERIEDRDDSAGAVDLSLVRASHNRVSDELVYVIDLHEPITPQTLVRRDGPPGSICVNVWTSRRPGEAAPNYDACITSERRGRVFRASVARHVTSGAVRRVGRAKVEQQSPTRLVLRIDPDRVGRPAAVRWTVQAVAFSSGCPPVTGCEDFVPDRPESARTTLSEPRRTGGRD